MSVTSEYADRLAERHNVLRRLDQTLVSWEEGYVPLVARRGPDHARQHLDKFHTTLTGERKRVREEQIKKLLDAQPTWDLLWRVPLGSPKSIRELVQQEARVVLMGGAATGKTTALRSLAVHPPEWARGERLLTVLVDLSTVPNLGEAALPDVLSQDAQEHLSVAAAPAFFEEALVHGEVLVCVDGLDELPGPQARALAIRQIESWVSEFPNGHYVVAARPNTYEPALSKDDFVHYALTPWSRSVVQDLDLAWNQALDEWAPEEPDRPFSTERSALWQQLAWVMRVHERSSLSLAEAEEWLAEAVRASKQLHLNRRRVPGEVQALLEQSVPHLPLVQVQDGQLSFVLPLVQDILAARALEAQCGASGVEATWAEIAEHLDTSAWRETIGLTLQFLAESHPDLCEALTLRLLSADESAPWESLLHQRLLLAASAVRASSATRRGPDGLSQDVRQQAIDRLVAWMSDADAVGREDALSALLQLEGEAYVTEQALEVAGDETRDVWSREAALLLLGRLGGMRASETIELLAACADPSQVESRIQLAAVTSLGALGADGNHPSGGSLTEAERASVVEWLLGCIRNPDAAIDVRVAAGEALSTIHSAAPDDAIVEVLVALARAENGEERPPYSVQIAAAKGLTRVLSTGSNPELTEQMRAIAGDAEINDAVRTPLAEALGGLGAAEAAAAEAAAAEAAAAEAAAKVLMEIVHDPKVYAPGQRAALDALGRVGHSALDWSANEAILDQVVQIAQTKDRKVKDFVRLAAARALSGLGHVDLAIQHMILLIADKSLYRTTRNDALGFLAQLGSTGEADLDAAVVAVLQIWLNEENTTEDVRENAIESLRVLRAGQEEVIRDMIAVIQNKGTYPRVRRVAAAQLGRFPVEQKEMVVEALSPVFYDPEEKSDLLRVPIARMLFLWGEDEQALAYLRLAAEQSYMAQVRYNAAMVLLEIGEVGLGTVELLLLAQNPDISDVIRSDAARALGLWQVGNQDVAAALAGIVRDAELEPNVRDAAYASLRATTA